MRSAFPATRYSLEEIKKKPPPAGRSGYEYTTNRSREKQYSTLPQMTFNLAKRSLFDREHYRLQKTNAKGPLANITLLALEAIMEITCG